MDLGDASTHYTKTKSIEQSTYKPRLAREGMGPPTFTLTPWKVMLGSGSTMNMQCGCEFQGGPLHPAALPSNKASVRAILHTREESGYWGLRVGLWDASYLPVVWGLGIHWKLDSGATPAGRKPLVPQEAEIGVSSSLPLHTLGDVPAETLSNRQERAPRAPADSCAFYTIPYKDVSLGLGDAL